MVAVVIWLAMLRGDLRLPSRFDPLTWHIHEMLFGFVLAAVAGFLLTAIANWTDRLPVRGGSLALLASLWAVGRIACLISADLPAWLAVVADLSFPVLLFVVATREITAGRNWRNLPMTAPLALFIVADLLMHLESVSGVVARGLGWRLGLSAPILLISFIGGRIIPSFTRNWLLKRRSARLPAPQGAIDIAAIGLLCAGLLLWAILPAARATGMILLAAGALNAWRLVRWTGAATWPEPLLFILHIGYTWVVVGIVLLALSILGAEVPVASAIHALTAGAIGTMILAVMPRVALGHTGRNLTANRTTIVIFILIIGAGIARVAASWNPTDMPALLVLSAACWVGAFGLFEIAYGPMLFKQRLTPSSSSP